MLLGRYEEATEALDAMLRIAADYADPDEAQWFLDLVAQARGLQERIAADPAGTRQTLLAGAEEQRRRQRLPVTDG